MPLRTEEGLKAHAVKWFPGACSFLRIQSDRVKGTMGAIGEGLKVIGRQYPKVAQECYSGIGRILSRLEGLDVNSQSLTADNIGVNLVKNREPGLSDNPMELGVCTVSRGAI